MRPIAKLRRSERGAVVVMVAVWLPVLALFASFAIDFGHFFDYSRNLQNRADAIAIAAGDQLGNLCATNPTNPRTSPELPVGAMGQLFSGPPGSGSDLPYVYGGSGSPLDTNPATGPLASYWAGLPNGTPVQYQNVPNLSVSNGTNGANYHALLNANNYTDAGGTNFAMGDFCHGNPTLDATDKECFGQTNLTGQLALDCATGAMIDAKVTQTNLPLFFPLFRFSPNISAHARVAAQGIGVANNLKPLGVEDPGVVPCVQVKFVGPSGSQTVQLLVNNALTTSNGPIIWDNSGNNGGAGDAINIPSGANLYMQTTLYAPGVSGTCSTMGSPLVYEQNSGILMLNSYGTSVPTATQAPRIIGNNVGAGICPTTDACGVTLVNSTCAPDQYFSNMTGNCTAEVCAIVAFTPGSSNQRITINGTNINNPTTTDPNCHTSIAGASAWESNPITINSQSGQTQFTITWRERASGVCSGNCTGSFGVQQQTFAACNENFNATCTGDPNISGPIVKAQIIQGAASTIGSFQGGTTHNLVIRLSLQGLQDSPRTDRCSVGPTQCTLLRVDQGNADGMVDCGNGNGANAARTTVLYGCPLYGQTATPTNPSACSNTNYCGSWMPVPAGTPDGVCNYTGRTAATNVDCVNTNNNGATMPGCIQALVVSGGASGVVNYNNINANNCHVTGSTCSEDKWLTGAPIVPGAGQDPRIITAFIVFQGDIAGATGNHDMQIRTFASFYVTGWQSKGNGQSVNCGNFNANSNPGGNEPAPSSLPNNADAIWGHWITYTEVGAGGNGQPCNFNAFGDCAVVLTR
jgi:hypothetical protein